MTEKTCGNCKSNKLILVKQTYNAYYSPHISMGIGKKVKIRRTVCEVCGHVDEWVTDELGLERLKIKYLKKK